MHTVTSLDYRFKFEKKNPHTSYRWTVIFSIALMLVIGDNQFDKDGDWIVFPGNSLIKFLCKGVGYEKCALPSLGKLHKYHTSADTVLGCISII